MREVRFQHVSTKLPLPLTVTRRRQQQHENSDADGSDGEYESKHTRDRAIRTPTASTSAPSVRQSIIRAVLQVLIFLILFTLVERYVLTPLFRPDYMQNEQELTKRQIAAKACPQGFECQYDLLPQYRQ